MNKKKKSKVNSDMPDIPDMLVKLYTLPDYNLINIINTKIVRKPLRNKKLIYSFHSKFKISLDKKFLFDIISNGSNGYAKSKF